MYVDANVLVSALASLDPVDASSALLSLSNVAGCFDLLCAETAKEEAVRHVRKKVPDGVKYLHELLSYEVDVVPDPSEALVETYEDEADPKDVVHLASAIEQDCDYIATYNLSDFYYEGTEVDIVEPGYLVQKGRDEISAALP